MKVLLQNVLILLILAGAQPVHAEDKFFDSNGVQIRYVTAGEGEPVVLIHGWMSSSAMWGSDWAGNTKLDTKDSKGFLLIAIDCRGHGKSDKPHDATKYGAEMAADVVRLLDHLKLKKAHLIGYSAGAFIAAKVAATHPDRVLSIVYGGQAPLIAEPKSRDFAEAKPKPNASSEVEIFARAVDEGKDLGSYLIAVMPPGRPKPTPEEAKALAAFLYGGKDLKAFALAGRSFDELEVDGAQLKKCTAPVLFIHGSNEVASTKTRVAAVRKLLGHGEIKVVEGADHVSTLGKPEFGKAIVDFIHANKQK
ncbi:alpha/beta hydrolase [soil metagenome]